MGSSCSVLLGDFILPDNSLDVKSSSSSSSSHLSDITWHPVPDPLFDDCECSSDFTQLRFIAHPSRISNLRKGSSSFMMRNRSGDGKSRCITVAKLKFLLAAPEHIRMWQPVTADNVEAGTYQVSSDGWVRSLQSYRIWNPTDFTKNHYGYLTVSLVDKGGKSKHHLVHCLVAAAFLGQTTKGIHHKDGNKANNISSNLEHATASEISKYSAATLLFNLYNPTPDRFLDKQQQVNRNPPVHQFDKDEKFIQTFPNSAAARKAISGLGSLSQALSGKQPSAGGFLWMKGSSTDSAQIVYQKPSLFIECSGCRGKFKTWEYSKHQKVCNL